MTLVAGTNLGPYKIVEPLGAGGMGEVYRARDTRLDRDVAIKVLPAAVASAPEALARFEREAKAVAALSHPNIVALFDVGRHENTSYVVMELLEGETLRVRISRSALSPRKAIELGVAIADGLAAAHSKNVIHRDLKPENIFITAEGLVKILDFGLARATGPAGPTHDLANSPTLTVQTSPGAIIGTLCYMAPEQIRGAATDARTDIFAFGCVMYEMLTGRRAFLGETAADTMTAILKEDPPSVQAARSGVGLELERLIDRCLEKRPEQRFQSASDLAFTLRSGTTHTHAGIPASPRGPLRWMAISGIVLLAAAASTMFVVDILLPVGQNRLSSESHIKSLAVLPFVNTSNDAEVEYIGDGISESVMNALARVPGLQVVPRSRAFSYKGNQADPIAVGRELGVQGVLTGRIVKRGDRLNIQAELAHVGHNRQVWGQQYELPADELLTTQQRIVKDLSTILDVSLSGDRQQTLTARDPKSAEAYDWYLRGSYHWNRYSTEGFRKAIECFDRALEIDPLYAAAYAGLGMAYYRAATNVFPPLEAMPKAKRAAQRALELDSTIAEAQVVLGVVAYRFDWNWSQAEESFKTAIRLAPDYATAHEEYGFYLGHLLRFDEAIAELEKASSLDPLSLIIASRLAVLHMNAGHHDQAIARLRRTLDIDPVFHNSLINLSLALALAGRTEEALTETRRTLATISDETRFAQSASCFALANEPDEARAALAELEAARSERYVNLVELAIGYASLGDRQRAMDLLEESYAERGEHVSRLLMEARLKDMRSEPRFRQLVEKIGLGPYLPKSAPFAHSKPVLAVLPFVNDSGDAELVYLSDGIAESLINGFSRLEGLSTVPRSSAFRHKGAEVDPVEAGKQLSASAVLSGRVLKRGDNLTIQAELVDVAEGRQLWGERYQRKLADLVEIERDIARDITDALRLKLTGEEKQSLSRGYSQDSEAYRLYLHGRHSWTKRSKEGLENALRLFNEAVEIDPDFALAYSGLSDTYSLLPLYGWMSPREAGKKARQTAEKALQLDDGLAEAHTSMGMVWFYIEWEFDKAEREFAIAEQLNPRYATVQQWWGLCAGAQGRYSEAKAKLRRAIELDPLTPIFTHNLGWVSSWEHDWPAAMAAAKSGLDFAPEFFLMHQLAGWAQMELGQPEEAVASLKKAIDISQSASFARAYYANALGRVGRTAECQAMIDGLIEESKTRYVPPTDLAIMYVGLGQKEEALAWLEKAFEAKDVWLTFLAVHCYWDPLREDPRFADLLRRMGLPNLQSGQTTTP